MKILELDELRARGVRLLTLCGWIFVALLGLGVSLGLLVGGWPLVLFAAVLNILPTFMTLQGRHDQVARMILAVVAAAYPALLVYAQQGDRWQMDMHMYFFVALAALAILCDWRPLLLATGLVAVHHLLLDYVAPQWVFQGVGNFSRVMVHAVAIVLECAVLVYLTRRMRSLLISQGEARGASEILAREAEAATAEALKAQAAAEQALAAAADADQRAASERGRREQFERAAADLRSRDLLVLAEQFESSVHAVVASVGAAATQLESASSSLSDLANDSGRQSAAVAERATGASRAARAVAGSVGELSRSIAGIAASIDRQAELSARARSNSTTGDQAVRAPVPNGPPTSASSPAASSPSRRTPTSSRSTRRSRPLAPVRPARASRSSRQR